MVDPETRIDIAKRHVLEARRTVERQKRLIERRKKSGLDTTDAEALLQSFERALSTFEDDLAKMKR